MLIQFSVENCLSFGEETTLSMLPAKSRKQKEHIIHSLTGKSVSVLPLVAFYGANASGKSNFIRAFDFFRSLVIGEVDTIKSIPVSTFKLKTGKLGRPCIRISNNCFFIFYPPIVWSTYLSSCFVWLCL